MDNDPKVRAERWLGQARADIEEAGSLLNGRRYASAFFTAQQAAEKAFKSFLYYKGAGALWSCSVAALCIICADYEPSLGGFIEKTSFLDKYDFPGGYVDGTPVGIPVDAFEEADAKQALGIAHEVIIAVALSIS